MYEALLTIEEAQLKCLARAIYHEARSESYAGQLYVGFVIYNRVNDERFEDDFCKVIREPWQFSFVHEKVDKTMYEPEAKETAYEAAYTVMTTYPCPIPEDILYYHTVDIKPSWNYSLLEVYKTVGSHVFYGEK